MGNAPFWGGVWGGGIFAGADSRTNFVRSGGFLPANTAEFGQRAQRCSGRRGSPGADSRTDFARSQRISPGKHGGFGQRTRQRNGRRLRRSARRNPGGGVSPGTDSRRILPVPGGFPGKHGGFGQRVRQRSGRRGFAGIIGTARQQATHPRSTDPKSRQKPIYTAVSAARGTRSIRATSGGLPIRGQDRMHKPRDTISRCPVRS